MLDWDFSPHIYDLTVCICLLPPPCENCMPCWIVLLTCTNPHNTKKWDCGLTCNKKKLWKPLLQMLPELGNASSYICFMHKVSRPYWKMSFILKAVIRLWNQGKRIMFLMWWWQYLQSEAAGEMEAPDSNCSVGPLLLLSAHRMTL